MGWPGPMTHRQFRVWRAWLEMDMDRPGKAEWYIMQATAEGIRPHLKKGAKVGAGDYKMKFTTAGRKKKAPAPAQSLNENKAIWLNYFAGAPGVKYVPGPAEAQAPAAGGG